MSDANVLVSKVATDKVKIGEEQASRFQNGPKEGWSSILPVWNLKRIFWRGIHVRLRCSAERNGVASDALEVKETLHNGKQ